MDGRSGARWVEVAEPPRTECVDLPDTCQGEVGKEKGVAGRPRERIDGKARRRKDDRPTEVSTKTAGAIRMRFGPKDGEGDTESVSVLECVRACRPRAPSTLTGTFFGQCRCARHGQGRREEHVAGRGDRMGAADLHEQSVVEERNGLMACLGTSGRPAPGKFD